MKPRLQAYALHIFSPWNKYQDVITYIDYKPELSRNQRCIKQPTLTTRGKTSVKKMEFASV